MKRTTLSSTIRPLLTPWSYGSKNIQFVVLKTKSIANVSGTAGNVLNFLSREAYRDKCDFFYRIFDDTEFVTPWTSAFITALHNFTPPLRGVVGPMCAEGKDAVLAHNFVHRSHLDIFSALYPTGLSEDMLDDWIVSVYGHDNAQKLSNVVVRHDANQNSIEVKLGSETNLRSLVERGRVEISRASGLKVIAYSLFGDIPRYIDGAMVNAKLIAEFFPGWTMRVYHDRSVPEPVLQYLRDHDVELVDMSDDPLKNQMAWRFLPAGEEALERFTSRDIDSRLSVREAAAVKEWEESGLPFHVMRDHPSHSAFAVWGGMWGSTGGAIKDIRDRLMGAELPNKYMADMHFLNSQMWGLMGDAGVMVHDAVTCDRTKTRPFPTQRQGSEHVGSVYIDGAVREGDAFILLKAIAMGKLSCSDRIQPQSQSPLATTLPSILSGADAVGNLKEGKPEVCILIPVTSRKRNWMCLEDSFLYQMPLKSLVNTSEPDKFAYAVYVGYDAGDTFFDNETTLSALEGWMKQSIPYASLAIRSFVNALRKPGPIMNFLSREAYNAGCDFMYRINDDTEFLTPWTGAFVDALRGFTPPLRGVVGPTCHEGNTAILTHDFVHRSHLDLFRTHYPPELTDWWLDNWITMVYGDQNTRKLSDVVVRHPMLVTRYEVLWESQKILKRLVELGRHRYMGGQASR
jgi:hypothetical protein